jgi:hypothetical protein
LQRRMFCAALSVESRVVHAVQQYTFFALPTRFWIDKICITLIV